MDNLKPGIIIDNITLCDHFKCSSQGGMRRSHKTNSLIIISNHIKSIYEDRWIGDVLHYTGMGTKGDQSLDFAQNKTLNGSRTNGVNVHFFEVFKEKEYTYIGKIKLNSDPYIDEQPDSNSNLRKVWMFPLTLIEGNVPILEQKQLEKLKEFKQKKAKKLTLEELKKRASASKGKTSNRKVSTTQYIRNPWVSEYAQRMAKGKCQLCNKEAPFYKKNKDPYLETHHIVWLSKGGEDIIENTVALCPNCHRKMHIVKDKKDIEILSNM